ncbi:hypothetical protein MLD38_004603 [Melastoma candidum]|uniref:Uncharacterized protein n=1 Tax=Melastoma candidum TaxID=119954 RepID=A0ACB9SET5_9MYRT|nr:hypothetical protein MLD38_004603 [Melastoma candidum]
MISATAVARTSTSSEHRKGVRAEGRTPNAAEIEEFFAKVERGSTQLLKDKYNYDFEWDMPLEGRYEWVEIGEGGGGGGGGGGN